MSWLPRYRRSWVGLFQTREAAAVSWWTWRGRKYRIRYTGEVRDLSDVIAMHITSQGEPRP